MKSRKPAIGQIEGLGAQLVAPGRDAVLAWHEHAVKIGQGFGPEDAESPAQQEDLLRILSFSMPISMMQMVA